MLDELCRRTRRRTWPWGRHPIAGLAAPPASGHELLPGLGGCGHELISGDRDGQVPLSCHAMLCRTMPCWGKPCVVSDGAVGKEPRGVAVASRKELLTSQPAGTGSVLPRLQLTLSALRSRAGEYFPGATIPVRTLPCSMALAVMREREKKRTEIGVLISERQRGAGVGVLPRDECRGCWEQRAAVPAPHSGTHIGRWFLWGDRTGQFGGH